LIIPDLPVDVYDDHYKTIFEKYGLINVFLITPQTSLERILFIDQISEGFIYMVSSASVTGSQNAFGKSQDDYFKRIADLNLKSPQIIGFGISNAETFKQATKFAKGAIIGSAFVKYLDENGTANINKFVNGIRD
jgi:tryptophan synthase alpha chain